MEEKKLFGSKVAFYRKERKLKQKELADALGIKKLAMNRIENGVTFPKGELLFKIAETLEVKLKDLFDF